MKRQPEKSWTSADEDNLLLEISEDRRLRNLGINPDMDQVEIWDALTKLQAKLACDEESPR